MLIEFKEYLLGITQTDTGNIDVPKTVNGGRCEISTDTGDIKISVKKG